MQWPDGTYALPMPSWGCPHGWSSGWRFQDTEKHHPKNRKSWGIGRKMKFVVGKDVTFYYCVKRVSGNSGLEWPRGTYCIAKSGDCPHGFKRGGIYWDDENKNRNRRWGVLPDGRYDRNTAVEYCCCSDANHYTPMVLFSRKPFILYQYGGRCQRVKGMHISKLYIKWDDENHHNHDKCWGSHPDATCWKNQVLHFCYYYWK